MIAIVRLLLLLPLLFQTGGFTTFLTHEGASVWYLWYDPVQMVGGGARLTVKDCGPLYTDLGVITYDFDFHYPVDRGYIRFESGSEFQETSIIPYIISQGVCSLEVIAYDPLKLLQRRIFLVAFGKGVRNDQNGHPLPTFTPTRTPTRTPTPRYTPTRTATPTKTPTRPVYPPPYP